MLRGMSDRPYALSTTLITLHLALWLASCTSLPPPAPCKAAPSPAGRAQAPLPEDLPDPGDFPPLRFAQ